MRSIKRENEVWVLSNMLEKDITNMKKILTNKNIKLKK